MNLITLHRRHVPTPVVLVAIARSLLLVAAAAAGAGERNIHPAYRRKANSWTPQL